jgi:DNA-binding winged helix-turn-helix (wHTH) protein/tetratricopeptide (TPR) repeat protein
MSGERRLLEFGPFRLDLANRLLLRGAAPVALTPKTFDLLALLAGRAGELVTKDEILERIWPDAFIEEGNLTQTVYMLRRALGGEGGLGESVETVPRRGYRFTAPVRELTAEATPAGGRGRRPAGSGAARPVASIAVLPFEPLAAGPDDEYLGLGMADAVITRLSNLRRLRVRPTSAVRDYTGRSHDAAAAARELQVDSVLDGTLQRAGERIRVNVQLVDVREEAPQWAAQFDAMATDLFELQDSISRQLVAELSLKLSRREKERLTHRSTLDPAAYQAYIKGWYFWNKRTADGLDKAVECFEEALGRDAAFAQAYAGLADCYLLMPLYANLPSTEAFPRANAAALRALDLDPTLAEAHTSLAYVRFFYDRDWAAAEASFRRAIALNPGYPTAHHWYAYYLAAMGRHEEAAERGRRALALDPLSLVINTDLGFVLYFARRYEEAVAQLRTALELDPGFAYGHFALGHTYLQLGRSEEAVGELRQAVELSGASTSMLAALGIAQAAAGRSGEARAVVAELERRAAERHVEAAHFAFLAAALGDRARAIELLAKACDERSRFVVFLNVWPIYDPLRGEPGWPALVRRVGLAAE